MTEGIGASDFHGFPDDVDVAVVSHNGRATLPHVIECLQASGAPLDRIAVYDIGSTDGTAQWLADAWPAVAVRRLDENVGPNPARNLALEESKRPAVLVLDADAYLRPDAPRRLRNALDPAACVALVSPVVVQAGRPDRIQYAGVSLHFICEAVNPWIDRAVSDRGRDSREVGSAAGVALLIDRAAAQSIGLFDNRLFMGKDDGDFCYRLRLAGYRLVEAGDAIVEHETRPRSTWMFRYQIRNRWYFIAKNYAPRTIVVLFPVLCVHEVIQLGLLVVKGHAGAWWRAVLDLLAWRRELPAERRAVQAQRTVGDRQLLVSAPLLVRADLVGGGAGRYVKRAYDGWLACYWAIARHLIS